MFFLIQKTVLETVFFVRFLLNFHFLYSPVITYKRNLSLSCAQCVCVCVYLTSILALPLPLTLDFRLVAYSLLFLLGFFPPLVHSFIRRALRFVVAYVLFFLLLLLFLSLIFLVGFVGAAYRKISTSGSANVCVRVHARARSHISVCVSVYDVQFM